MTTPATTKLALETEPCTRCGGTGQYSYCQRYGRRCFKCGGSGKQLTRKARKVSALLAEQLEGWGVRREARGFSSCLSDVKPGDVIGTEWDGRYFNPENPISIPLKGQAYRTVERVDVDKSRCFGWMIVNGEKIETSWHMTVRFTDGTTYESQGNVILPRRLSAEQQAARSALFRKYLGKGVVEMEAR